MEIFYYLMSVLVWGLIWGVISSLIGNSKNIKGFWWGFFLGFIGVIIVICLKPNDSFEVEQNINKMQSGVVRNKYDELEKLDNLRKMGAITEYEFEEEKKKLLK